MPNELDDVKIPVGKIIGYTVLFLVVVMALGWLIQGNDFFMYKFWAPKQEAVRRQVFEQTRSFNQGMVQELENMEADYMKTKDPEAKAALASIILHRASGYNLDDPIVPADLRSFISKLKQERMDAR
ncbi:MAG: hypothetical protein KW788_00030 [Candidatus Doudnabacteria bacterium]|nr:hypothetical protein [Candidatus Doudnabacteria bacterium]